VDKKCLDLASLGGETLYSNSDGETNCNPDFESYDFFKTIYPQMSQMDTDVKDVSLFFNL
jgi:hypothetical protein